MMTAVTMKADTRPATRGSTAAASWTSVSAGDKGESTQSIGIEQSCNE